MKLGNSPSGQENICLDKKRCNWRWGNLLFLFLDMRKNIHCRKSCRFSRPQPGGHQPNSPWRGIIKYFLSRESLVGDISAEDGGKFDNLFLQCIWANWQLWNLTDRLGKRHFWPTMPIVRSNVTLGVAAKLHLGSGAQRPVTRVTEPKKVGSQSARARSAAKPLIGKRGSM